jgi:hypothetical protein
MKSIYKPMLFLAFAASAGLAAASTLMSAGVVTDLTQCEVQTCGAFPHNLSYNGPLSGYSGTQTVGEGANVTITGSPLPSVSSQVPTAGANAIISAELNYLIEVVPVNGDPNLVPVQLGVNAVGTTSVATVANSSSVIGGGLNDASDFLQLALLSDSSGTAVFSDVVNLHYVNGFTDNTDTACDSTNTSTTLGAGFISNVSLSCGGSSASGGINETGSYSISANALYEVVMIANITVGTQNDGNANGSGSVQASEFIDPMFTVPAGYMLLLSPGIGNGATATPEPSTWTMLAAGMGLLIVSRWRRVKGLFQ